MHMLVTKYVGFLVMFSVARGRQFHSNDWNNMLQIADIADQSSGVESHNVLFVGEWYHLFHCTVYNKVKLNKSTLTSKMALQIAVKALNDTSGPSGLVPFLLVFGVVPRSPLKLLRYQSSLLSSNCCSTPGKK